MAEPRENRRPERPEQHIIGDAALRAFQYWLPGGWVLNESRRDYGWDILVTTWQDGQVGEDFFVQLKGTRSPKYIHSGTTLSLPLKVSTLNWLLAKPMPSMLCICDLSREQEPLLCFAWIQEDTRRIGERNPNWRGQGNVAVHVPKSQVLNRDAHGEIEQYVRGFYEELSISAAIGTIVGPGLGFEKPRHVPAYTDTVTGAVAQRMSDAIADTGLAQVSRDGEEVAIEALSEQDRSRFGEIRRSSAALNQFQDEQAEAILDKLAGEIALSCSDIRARYHNNRGVLALHRGDYDQALQSFRAAEALRPGEVKYATNSLRIQLLHGRGRCGDARFEIPEGWTERLDDVLARDSGYPDALLLRARSLGITLSAEAGREFLQGTELWETQPVRTRCELAEMYADEGRLDRAIDIMSAVDCDMELPEAAGYYDLYGGIHLRKAFGCMGNAPEFTVYGPGPSRLDLAGLREAERWLLAACEKFSALGFPHASVSAVVNLIVTQRILGRTSDATHFARSF